MDAFEKLLYETLKSALDHAWTQASNDTDGEPKAAPVELKQAA
jgi:hypothetical protein